MINYESLKDAVKHYSKEDNCCSVITLALLKNWKFGRARKYMNKYCNRKDGSGVYRRTDYQRQEFGGKLGNFEAFEQALKADNKKLVSCDHLVGKRVRAIADGRIDLQGDYVVYVKGHVFAIINGVIQDIMRSPNIYKYLNCGKTVQHIYKVEEA